LAELDITARVGIGCHAGDTMEIRSAFSTFLAREVDVLQRFRLIFYTTVLEVVSYQ
jgi:hypothetical protein